RVVAGRADDGLFAVVPSRRIRRVFQERSITVAGVAAHTRLAPGTDGFVECSGGRIGMFRVLELFAFVVAAAAIVTDVAHAFTLAGIHDGHAVLDVIGCRTVALFALDVR